LGIPDDIAPGEAGSSLPGEAGSSLSGGRIEPERRPGSCLSGGRDRACGGRVGHRCAGNDFADPVLSSRP
jgi:hypothetical protein